MGEYINYKGDKVKIGTCESLYYITYDRYLEYQRERFEALGLIEVPFYLKVEEEFMFRFPFPDENKLKFGEIIEPHNRRIEVSFDKDVYDKNFGKSEVSALTSIGIAMQKPILRASDGQFCLALIVEDYRTRMLYRLEDKSDAKIVVNQIVGNHLLNETNPAKRDFYRQVACRILKGYDTKYLLAQREFLAAPRNLNREEEISQPTEKTTKKSNDIERSRKKGKRM